MNSSMFVSCAVVSVLTLAANAGGVTSWNTGVSGVWNFGPNWSSGLEPTSVDDVLISVPGIYTVSTGSAEQAGTITISNADATLSVLNAHNMDVFGDVVNDGTVGINLLGSGSATGFDFENNATLSGTGEFVLNATGVRARIRTGAGMSLTQSLGHTIRGVGQIEADLTNNGLVSADVAGSELLLNVNDKVNNNAMRAIGGGILDVNGITLTQGAGGVLRADGVGSQVQITSSSVVGGAFETSGGGKITNTTSSTITSVTNRGDFEVPNATTLDVSTALTNDGTILVNQTGGGSATGIDFIDMSILDGDGEMVLSAADSRARVRTDATMVMTHGSDHTIRGFGQIEANMINNGLISADVDTRLLRLNVNNKVNNSVMQAIGGGTLDITGVTITQGVSGDLIANGVDSVIEFHSGTVVGGDLITINSGLINVVSSGTLSGVELMGVLHVQNAATLNIASTNSSSGTIVVNPTSGGSATSLDVQASSSFEGNGSVHLASLASRARLRTLNGAVATNGAGHTIFGTGQIEASLINNGVVESSTMGDSLLLHIEDKLNNATIRATNGAEVDVSGVTIAQSALGIMSAQGVGSVLKLRTCLIDGGEMTTSGGGIINVTSVSELSNVNMTGSLEIPNASRLNISAGTLNNGTIVVNPTSGGSATSLRWESNFSLEGTGSIVLNASATRARLLGGPNTTQATLGAGQRLSGIGLVSVNLVHHGTIAPGLSVGTINANSPVAMSDTSNFEVEVNTTTADLFDSNSSVAIDGTLDVLFVDGFSPTGYWVRTIVEGSSITGKFDAVNVPAAPSGFVTRVINTGTKLLVGQTCPSDQNLDGTLNFFDVSVFLAAYANMDPSADLTGDGMFNFFDVSAFLANYSAGCSF